LTSFTRASRENLNILEPGRERDTAAQFRAAWRHIVDLARAQGAHNIRWVWCPNVATSGTTPFARVWPGRRYVDWMCLDGYNWSERRPGGTWRSMRKVFARSIRALSSIRRDRS
jgi:hypothetical protein